jgi:hypothetical protein
MFTKIHKRLGTPGVVLGIVACVIALSGTAIAALPGLNSKQKKEVKKIAKRLVKPGSQGVAGPVGPQGAAGAAGKDGSPGAPGQPGETGETGEAGVCSAGNPTCILPPGATATGDWNFSEKGAAYAFVALSYPLRVPNDPHFNFINEGGVAEVGSTANCGGTALEPEAEPGNLCVYTKVGQNLGTPTFEGEATADTHSGMGFAFVVPTGEEVIGVGSWAVTAPCAPGEPSC